MIIFRLLSRLTAGFLLAALLALAACGGGGGGGGGGSGAVTTPVVYAGNTSPAVVTTANAPQLIANVIGSDDTAEIIGGVAVESSGPRRNRGSGLVELARRFNRGFHDAMLRANAAQRVAPAIQVNEVEPCDNNIGSVSTSGTLNDTFGTGTLQISFNGCLIDGITVNGPATLRVDAAQVTFSIVVTDSTLSFSRLTFRGSALSIDSGGSLRTQLGNGNNTETITENVVSLNNSTGEFSKTENLIFVDVYDNIFSPSLLTETMGGRVFHSVHGWVDVSTIEPLVFSAPAQLFPNPGQLALTGSGSRSIRITAISATQVMFELDLDSDTSYESWTTIPWTQLSGGAVVDFVRPTAPIVSVAVNMDRSVTISWTPSSDSSGIREYRIRRGTMPIGRTTGTTFTDRSVEPGSIVDYRVRAVDNAGNLSDLVSPTSAMIPSGGTGTFAQPLLGTLPFVANTNGVGIEIADVNGDGSRDLVVSGGDASQIATSLGPVSGGIAFTVSPIDFATMSNDSNLPFFGLANITGSDLPEALGAGRTLVWNTSNNVWEDSAGSMQSFQFEARAYIDLNNDGILDIVRVTTTSNFIARLSGTLGTGNGSYDSSSMRELAGVKNFVWSRIGAIVATDVDRDGLTDLIVWDMDTIRIVRQTQRGLFAVTASLPAIDNAGFRAALLVADISGDGYPDIIYAHYASSPDELRVYVNDGAGGYSTTAVSSGVAAPWNFSAADLNGDGIPDLVVGNRLTTNLDLYTSQGNGTFTFSSSIIVTGFPRITLADIDLDGDMDIVVGPSFGGTDVRIYRNQ